MNIIALSFGILLWIPISSLVLPLLLVFFLVSNIAHLFAKWRRPDLIPISKIDASIAIGPSNTDCAYVYTCQVWKIKGIIGVEQFRQHFHECFLSTEEDRRKYVNLYCYFVTYLGFVFKKREKSLDLNFHIKELILEKGTTVEEFLGKWMVTHVVDEKTGIQKPIWEVKIIPRGENTTVLFKLHHGMCDGYTMVHLVGKLSGTHAPYLFKEKVSTWSEFIPFLIQCPYYTIGVWIRMFLSKSKTMLNTCTKWKPEDGENWLISFCTLDLATIKEIRRMTNTKFANVMMAVHIGALRRLMCDFSENARELGDTYIGLSLGWPDHPVMTKGGGMTNHLTIAGIQSSLNIEDPLERLYDIEKNYHVSISNGDPKFLYYIVFNLAKCTPSWILRQCVNLQACETALSSLLCSTKPHYLLGHPVENLYLPLVTPSVAQRTKLMTVPVSHSGILDISINASTALVKNQQMLDRLTRIYFPKEVEALRKLCHGEMRCEMIFG